MLARRIPGIRPSNLSHTTPRPSPCLRAATSYKTFMTSHRNALYCNDACEERIYRRLKHDLDMEIRNFKHEEAMEKREAQLENLRRTRVKWWDNASFGMLFVVVCFASYLHQRYIARVADNARAEGRTEGRLSRG